MRVNHDWFTLPIAAGQAQKGRKVAARKTNGRKIARPASAKMNDANDEDCFHDQHRKAQAFPAL